jgi:Uncharacterised nucleotidyltransferase
MELQNILIDFISKKGDTVDEIINVIKDYQCERLLQDYIKDLDPNEYLLIEPINIRQRIANNIYINEIKQLASNFAEKDLHLVHLKGISLLNDIYYLDDYKKRKINDIDVLIKYDKMAESLDLLGDMGYVVESTNEKVSRAIIHLYLTDVENKGIHFPEFIKLVKNDNVEFKIKMDCHISIMHFLDNKDQRMSEIIERSERQTIEGVSIEVLEIHDKLLHLILHFTKEIFRCDTRWYLTGERRHTRDYRIRLPLLHEIALTIEKYEEVINWETIIARAKELYCHDELKLVLRMVNGVYKGLVNSKIIEAIEVRDADPHLKEKYMGMFFPLILKDQNIDFLLNSNLSEKSKAIVTKCYSSEMLNLDKKYYIDVIPENTGVEGHRISPCNTDSTIGEIIFSSTEDYFGFQIISESILTNCKGLFFTVGSGKRSNILSSFVNKFYIDLKIDNFSSSECFVLNGYIELRFKYQVIITLDRNEIVVRLPWSLIDESKSVKSIIFDVGVPELSNSSVLLPIQKYKLNDISKKGLGNVFHCSPLLLSTIQLD